MRYYISILFFLLLTAIFTKALGQTCAEGSTCVEDEDLARMVEVLEEKQCLQTEAPKFQLDSITIVEDEAGRIFYTGAEPKPYTLHMDWCTYHVKATGKVELLAARKETPIWGFRFRPKAYIGVLPFEALQVDDAGIGDVWDAGVMVDFLYYDWVSLNGAVGFQSFGGGVGIDLLDNFGSYVGYANTWGTWGHNVNLGLWFSFWNP